MVSLGGRYKDTNEVPFLKKARWLETVRIEVILIYLPLGLVERLYQSLDLPLFDLPFVGLEVI